MIEKAKQILAKAKDQMSSASKFLEESLRNYRAGKANPSIFNSVLVDYYGSKTPIPQVASVTTPDARTILIQPWDRNLIGAIEKAILAANVGMTPQNNGETIRCNVPVLTEERRKEREHCSVSSHRCSGVSFRHWPPESPSRWHR